MYLPFDINVADSFCITNLKLSALHRIFEKGVLNKRASVLDSISNSIYKGYTLDMTILEQEQTIITIAWHEVTFQIAPDLVTENTPQIHWYMPN